MLLAWRYVHNFASMSGWGVGVLYVLFVFVRMSSLFEIILLKQVLVLQITHRAIITSLEASKCSGRLLLALT